MSEQNHSKIYLLPNLMTAGNLFCGFTATLKILEGALLQSSNSDAAGDLFHTAIWFILAACFFDLAGRRRTSPRQLEVRAATAHAFSFLYDVQPFPVSELQGA